MIAGTGGTEHLRIYTTIDMDLQRAAYAALTKQMSALDKIQSKRFDPGTLQAALVAMNAKTGDYITLMTPTVNGSLNAMDVRVAGIFQTGVKELDEQTRSLFEEGGSA